MAIIQISKIQQRSGNLVDLPQLDEAEFGFASDDKRLFIGKEAPNENIEVLTSYSEISYSQLEGAVGNLNISALTVADGQVLTYDGNNWVNRGGNAGGLITLGDASNVKIDGGAIGYVLETDGTGNLSWTPKSTIIAYILNVTQANPAVVTTTEDNFFTDGAEITITGATGMTQLNGNTYYANVVTANTFSLYSDPGLTTTVNSTGYGQYAYANVTGTTSATNTILLDDETPFSVSDPVVFVGNTGNSGIVSNVTYYIDTIVAATGIKISETLGGNVFAVTTDTFACEVYVPGGRAISTVSGSGTAAAAGTTYSVQYNNYTLMGGGSDFTWNFDASPKVLTVNGNANVSNLNATTTVVASYLVSNVSTGTAPLIVSSTTKVANLNVDLLDGYDTATAATANTIVVRDASSNFSANVITATLSGNATTAGTVTTAAQPNITSVSTSFTNLTFADSQTLTGNNFTLSTGSSTNLGSITGNWSLTAGSRLTATYADLAEYYAADQFYAPGTVLEFGGDKEVTLSTPETSRVAGVVSTDPAYVMNSTCPGEYPVALALQGRVMCRVRGPVKKGDMLISAGDGYAKASAHPQMGTVIGKSLENLSEGQGMIEVAVGRL